MGAPTGEVSFEYDGTDYVMIFDMKAIAFFEREAGVSILESLQSLEEARVAGAMPLLSHLAFLMQAGLRKYHPAVTADEAMAMAVHPDVQIAMGVGLQSAMPPADGGTEGNVTTQAKVVASSTGTKPKKPRSKRG